MTITEMKIEEHPFPPFVPTNATKLIIGSIPPQRFCNQKENGISLYPDDVNFYYGSRDNSFWFLKFLLYY